MVPWFDHSPECSAHRNVGDRIAEARRVLSDPDALEPAQRAILEVNGLADVMPGYAPRPQPGPLHMEKNTFRVADETA